MANERLQAQVRAQLVEVEASRARIVTAADAERRRIERNLHDGAQQRLVALRLSLRLSAEQARTRGDVSASRFEQSAAELDEAIAELRELAQGIHPAILTDEGLGAATEVLLERSRLLADFRNSLPSRPPPAVEAAAYYVVAEALSIFAMHALATMVRVNLEHDEGIMIVSISDYGFGGADLKRGSGLEGLGDRVAAVGGQLEISSPVGGGTTLTATLPWEDS
jgi:signal transduction histidine kinase